ncbi:hypothetical protein F8M41_015152 [Gigaspora margarita]|uniref:Uncharacterized protein n=1 Tax=Gigaspora margarita TaxID=4874 RepID=A0A8H4AQS2_GIGMA|nr:hypothetical protein F8M41_015152 [Gigaspora margarita]
MATTQEKFCSLLLEEVSEIEKECSVKTYALEQTRFNSLIQHDFIDNNRPNNNDENNRPNNNNTSTSTTTSNTPTTTILSTSTTSISTTRTKLTTTSTFSDIPSHTTIDNTFTSTTTTTTTTILSKTTTNTNTITTNSPKPTDNIDPSKTTIPPIPPKPISENYISCPICKEELKENEIEKYLKEHIKKSFIKRNNT